MMPRRFMGDSELGPIALYCKLRPDHIECLSTVGLTAHRALGSEEILEERGAFRGKDARSHLRSVIEPRMPQQVSHRPGHSSFIVPASKDHALET